jgi:hypothetical protein
MFLAAERLLCVHGACLPACLPNNMSLSY